MGWKESVSGRLEGLLGEQGLERQQDIDRQLRWEDYGWEGRKVGE